MEKAFFFFKYHVIALGWDVKDTLRKQFYKTASAILLLLILLLCNRIVLCSSASWLARPESTMLISLQNIVFNARRHESCRSSPGVAQQASSVVVEYRSLWDRIILPQYVSSKMMGR